MSLTTFIGKILIIASIGFQAFLLFQDKLTIASFDRHLSKALTHSLSQYLTPDIQTLLKQHLRLVVVGLLASSVLLAVVNKWAIKLPVLLGLVTLLLIEHHDSFRPVPSL